MADDAEVGEAADGIDEEPRGEESAEAAGDPRLAAPPVAEVPRLFADGAKDFNEGRYWEAHEDWETAWHSLRNEDRADDARFLRGVILATAALENLQRGKPPGFQRQMAKALQRLRELRGRGADVLGWANEDAVREALTDLFLEAMEVRDLGGMDDLPVDVPRIEAAGTAG